MPGVAVSTTGSTRVLALDAVRGMAILAVIATHSLSATVAATGSYAVPSAIFKVFDFGQFGVEAFFVLSGWLIFSLYTGGRPFSQAVYWSRRWARIWPLWAIFLVASYLFYSVPDSGLPLWLAMLLGLLFLGWLSPALAAVPLGGLTIQQEMGHYLLFSLFRRRSAAFLAGTVIVGYLSGWTADFLLSRVEAGSTLASALEAWLRLSLFNSWPFFLLGAAGLVTWRAWRASGLTDLVRPRSWTAAAMLLALVLGLFAMYTQEVPGYFVLGYVAVLVGIALMGNALPVLGPVLRSVGRYSYFMYFFHFWVLRWIEALYRQLELPNDNSTSAIYNTVLLVTIWVSAAAVSWAVGYASWHLLEKRVLAFAHRRVPGPTRSPAPQG